MQNFIMVAGVPVSNREVYDQNCPIFKALKQHRIYMFLEQN